MTVVVRRDPLVGGFLIACCHEGDPLAGGFLIMYKNSGPVAQLVRALPCHGRGQGFESLLGRLQTIIVCILILFY